MHSINQRFMTAPNDFVQHLTRLNNKSYGSYKQLLDRTLKYPLLCSKLIRLGTDTYAFPQYTLLFEKVQSDPFAPPSQLRIRVDKNVAGFPEELYNTRDRYVLSVFNDWSRLLTAAY